MSESETPETPKPKPPRTFEGVPWQRQPNEGQRAWEAFQEYRNMGPKRSCAKVARKLGKSDTIIERWSRMHSWVKRVELYEIDEEKDYQAELSVQRREAARRHAEAGALLRNIALEILKKKYGERFEKLNAKSLTSGDVLRYIMEGAKLERAALGAPTEIIENQNTQPPSSGVNDADRKPVIPLTYAGRIDEALALLETARAAAAHGTTVEPS